MPLFHLQKMAEVVLSRQAAVFRTPGLENAGRVPSELASEAV